MSQAITSLLRTVTGTAAATLRQGKDLGAVRRAFEKRYRAITGQESSPDVWERLEGHARVVAVWGSSRRKELADEYERLAGRVHSGAPTVEELQAAVERLRAEQEGSRL